MAQLGFADLSMGSLNARRDRLGRIEKAIDWVPVSALLSRLRSSGGRPPYEPLAMFRALLLAQWHDLSDPALEDALADRASFRRFCGFSLGERTPDETTLCRFRLSLQKAGLGEALFAEVVRQLDARGLVLRKGTIVDASLIESAVRPPPSHSTPAGTESRSALDPDADWTRRGMKRELFFGYKAHIAVDVGSGLIRRRLLTGAKVYESEVADGLVCGDEGAVYADKAYEKKERRAALRAAGIKDRHPASPPQVPAGPAALAEGAQPPDRPHPRRGGAGLLAVQGHLRDEADALPTPRRQRPPPRSRRHRLQPAPHRRSRPRLTPPRPRPAIGDPTKAAARPQTGQEPTPKSTFSPSSPAMSFLQRPSSTGRAPRRPEAVIRTARLARRQACAAGEGEGAAQKDVRQLGPSALFRHRPLTPASLRSARSAEGRTLSPHAGKRRLRAIRENACIC